MTENFVDKCLQIYTARAAGAKNCRQLRICRHLKICRTGSVEKKYCRQLSTNFKMFKICTSKFVDSQKFVDWHFQK